MLAFWSQKTGMGVSKSMCGEDKVTRGRQRKQSTTAPTNRTKKMQEVSSLELVLAWQEKYSNAPQKRTTCPRNCLVAKRDRNPQLQCDCAANPRSYAGQGLPFIFLMVASI